MEPRLLPADAGTVVFTFHDPAAGRPAPMRVFAYFPAAVHHGAPTNVLFVMHGVKRDAENEFRRSIPVGSDSSSDRHLLLPEKHNFVLLVPEFSADLFPDRNDYNFGAVFEHEDPARPRPREKWSFSAIDRMYDAIKSAAQLNCKGGQ